MIPLAKKVLLVLIWSGAVVFLVNDLMVTVFATAVFYDGAELSDTFKAGYTDAATTINNFLIPLSVITFAILSYKNKLPKLVVRMDSAAQLPKVRVILHKIWSIARRWLLWGILPFALVMTLVVAFTTPRHTAILLPSAMLYVECVLLAILLTELVATERGHTSGSKQGSAT